MTAPRHRSGTFKKVIKRVPGEELLFTIKRKNLPNIYVLNVEKF